jgi:hypothetical protein
MDRTVRITGGTFFLAAWVYLSMCALWSIDRKLNTLNANLNRLVEVLKEN